jgi:hypothetical protein
MLESVHAADHVVTTRATVRRLGVYLDNWALIQLAKDSAGLRGTFLGCLGDGADLMFSPTNAAEVLGPEHAHTIDALKAFLDDVGPYWFPIEGPDVVRVMQREAAPSSGEVACVSSWFMNLFFGAKNLAEHGEQRFDLVGPEFYRLGFVLDWLRPHRDDIRRRIANFDSQLITNLGALRRAFDQTGKDSNSWSHAPDSRPTAPRHSSGTDFFEP